MKRVRVVLSLGLALVLLTACDLKGFTPSPPTATPTITTTPQPTDTPAPPTETETPEPTETSEPTETPSVTPTETPSQTPTPSKPLGRVTDPCLLLDRAFIEKTSQYPIAHVQKTEQPDGAHFCYWFNKDASAGVTLAVAQDKQALNVVVNDIVQFGAAPTCNFSQLPKPDAKSFQQELDALTKEIAAINQALDLRIGLDKRFKTIQTKGCADQDGVKPVTGFGSAAYQDSIYGYTELGVSSQDTLIFITVYAKGLAAPDALKAEETFVDAILKYLQTHP